MDENQLHYFSNEGMQRNLERQIKQTMRKSIRKSSSQAYSRSKRHIKRPSNPFIIWFQSEWSKSPNYSQEQDRNITSELEARWKSMSKWEKAPFYYEARKVKSLYKKFPSYQFQGQKQGRQKMRSIRPKETTRKTVEKSEEKGEVFKTSNARKEDVMSRCLAELVKLMNSPPPTKQSSKEDVMNRCMAELEQLMHRPSPNEKNYSRHMPTKSSSKIEKNEKKCSKDDVMSRCMAEIEVLMNNAPQTRNEVCETSKLRKDEVLGRVRDELIAKISAEQTPQYPSFTYPGYPSRTPFNSPCFPSPGYSYSSPAFYGSSNTATFGYGFSVDGNEQYMHQMCTPVFFQEAPYLEDSIFQFPLPLKSYSSPENSFCFCHFQLWICFSLHVYIVLFFPIHYLAFCQCQLL